MNTSNRNVWWAVACPIILLTFVICPIFSWGQDTIYFVDESVVAGRVTYLGAASLEYRSGTTGQDYLKTALIEDVFMIKYEDGRTLNFYDFGTSITEVEEAEIIADSMATLEEWEQAEIEVEVFDWYLEGRKDAKARYKDHSMATTATLFASTVHPLLGLPPAIITSLSTPQAENLNYPEQLWMSQPDYRLGYVKESRMKKARHVWLGWGVGVAINLTVVTYFVNK